MTPDTCVRCGELPVELGSALCKTCIPILYPAPVTEPEPTTKKTRKRPPPRPGFYKPK